MPRRRSSSSRYCVEVDRHLRHAGLHGGLRHGGSLPDEHARVERLGDDVLAAELQPVHAVGAQHRIGHVRLGQRGQRAGGRQLHLVVDGGGAHVQRAAEDEREAQDVVHLVGKVRAAGGHDGVRPRGQRHVVGDLGIGIGQGEDHRIGRHAFDHFGRHAAAARKPEEDVRAHQGFGQGAGLGLAAKRAL